MHIGRYRDVGACVCGYVSRYRWVCRYVCIGTTHIGNIGTRYVGTRVHLRDVYTQTHSTFVHTRL